LGTRSRASRTTQRMRPPGPPACRVSQETQGAGAMNASWQSAISHQPSAISHQPSASSQQPAAISQHVALSYPLTRRTWRLRYVRCRSKHRRLGSTMNLGVRHHTPSAAWGLGRPLPATSVLDCWIADKQSTPSQEAADVVLMQRAAHLSTWRSIRLRSAWAMPGTSVRLTPSGCSFTSSCGLEAKE